MKKILILLIMASVLLSGCSLFGKSKLPDTEKSPQTAQGSENPNEQETKSGGFLSNLFGGGSSKSSSSSTAKTPTATKAPSASSSSSKPIPKTQTVDGVTSSFGAFIGLDGSNQLAIIESSANGSPIDSYFNIVPEIDFSNSNIDIGDRVTFEYTTDANGVKTIRKIEKFDD